MSNLILIVILITSQIIQKYIDIKVSEVIGLREMTNIRQQPGLKGEQRANFVGFVVPLVPIAEGLVSKDVYLKRAHYNMSLISRVINVFDNRKKGVNGLVVQKKDPAMHIKVSSFIDGAKHVCINGEKRQEMGKIIRKYLQRDVYPFVEGFPLGGSDKLTYEQKSEVKRAGVSHLLSASGSNVSLVLLLNSPLLWKRFGRVFTGFMGMCAVIVYVFVAGCSAPLLRAATSSLFAVTASVLHHQASSLRVLFFSCAILLILLPHFLTNIGFQLSAAATLGICLFSKYSPNENKKKVDVSSKLLKSIDWQSSPMTAKWHKAHRLVKYMANKVVHSCKDSFRTTLAAQVFTLPIILYHFRELSIVVLVSNVALLWLMPYIITATVSLLIAATLRLHIVAVMIGIVTTLFTRVFLTIVHFFGNSDKVLVTFSQSQAERIVFVYLLSILMLFVAYKWTRRSSS